jgi:imidazolonepropionase-like amidohydrolase
MPILSRLYSCCCVLLLALPHYLKAQVAAQEIAFTHVNVITMDGRKVLRNQTVVVRGSVIYQIGPAKKTQPGKEAYIIEAKGKFLIPGISEMHAHIPIPKAEDESLLEETLLLYLYNGITVIRGMLGDPFHLILQDRASTGKILSPRVYTASPSLNGNSVKTPEEARQKIVQYAAERYDFLKIHPGIALPVMEALAAQAKASKIPFAGHVPAAVGIHKALSLGYAAIDHLDGFVEGLIPDTTGIRLEDNNWFGYPFTNLADKKRIKPLVKATARAGTWIVPTQSLLVNWYAPISGAELVNQPGMQYVAPGTRFQWQRFKQQIVDHPRYHPDTARQFIELRKQILREMERHKVNLLLGSDAPQVGNVPGFSIHAEMKALHEAGLSNYTILKSGTVNPARFLGAEDAFGVIRRGASADLLLLNGNPLDDIANMQRIAGVMTLGRWIPDTWITAQLAVIAAKNAGQ